MCQNKFREQSDDYRRVEQAIRFIEKNVTTQPSLEDIAQSVHMSKHHFSRMFKRWAGLSPIQFLHFLTLDHTKKHLASSESLLEASLSAGLSSPGRLHDLFINFEAMTPGEFKNKGAGLTITYGFAFTPFGECLLATTARGICYLGFVESDKEELLSQLNATWPDSSFIEDTTTIAPLVCNIFQSNRRNIPKPITLLVKGTNFQINVWKALLTIPEGTIVSYKDIARSLKMPKSSRAVGNALAINPIGYLIPCHRVITSSGAFSSYRWGTARKKVLIGWESSRKDSSQNSASL